MFKKIRLLRKKTHPLRCITILFSIIVMDGVIASWLCKFGYFQWIMGNLRDFVLLHLNYSSINLLRLCGSVMLGGVSSLIILYLMFKIVPDIVVDILYGPINEDDEQTIN